MKTGSTMKYKTAVWPPFWIIICLTLISDNTYAYEPPIGIPDPSWGTIHPIDTAAPAWPPSWPSGEVSGHYYIDNTHPSATDSGNSFGYPNKPRLTIPEITYSAGSYVEVHGGDYSDTDIQLSFNCTEASPCWLRGANPSSKPKISGKFSITESHYLIMENLDFDGGANGAIKLSGNSSSHISFRNSIMQNRIYTKNSAGFGITPDTGGTINDIVVYNNTFRDLGDWTTSVDNDFHAVNPGLWGRDSTTEEYNIWVLDNTMYHLSGNGIQVNAGNWANAYQYLHHIYIGRNLVHSNRQSNIGIKQSRDVIISQNELYNSRRQGGAPQPGSSLTYQYGPDNLWILFNKIHDSNYGIRQTSTNIDYTANTYIIGNLIYDIHPGPGENYDPDDDWRPGLAISFWRMDDVNRHVVDNTIADSTGAINIITGGSGYTEVKGNILSEIDDNDSHFAHNIPSLSSAIFERNLLFDTNSVRLTHGSNLYTTVGLFELNQSYATNNSSSNPFFVSPASGNYALSAGSTAIDSNSEHPAYGTFETLYGIDIRKDINGNPRPMGAGWDRGAYEATGTFLLAPTNSNSTRTN